VTAQAKRLSPPLSADVEAWLVTVFLSIAAPLERESELRTTEARPLTLNAFFELIAYLIQHLNFPVHIVVDMLEVRGRGFAQALLVLA
jgi:hypothetical protein